MGKVRTFGMAIAAFGLVASPVFSSDKKRMDVVKRCPGDWVVSASGACVAPTPSSDFKNAAPAKQADQLTVPLPKLELPPFDRSTENYKLAMVIVQQSMTPEMFDTLFRRDLPPAMEAVFLADPNIKEIETEYPGFAAYLAQKYIDFFMVRFIANFDYFLDAAARDFVNGMTLSELREILAFLQSSVGKKIFGNLSNLIQFDQENMAKAMQTDADKDWDAIITGDRKFASKMVDDLSPQEIDELTTFVNSPAFKKMQQINAASFEGEMSKGFELLLDQTSIDQFFEDAINAFFADK